MTDTSPEQPQPPDDLADVVDQLDVQPPPASRSRLSNVRRRQPVTRGTSPPAVVEDAATHDASSRVRVRSVAEESDGGSVRAGRHRPDVAAETELLGADGVPISSVSGIAPSEAGPAPGPPPAFGHAVDATILLVDAVRTYLDGLDRAGPDDPITVDRLARLRRTLAVWDDVM